MKNAGFYGGCSVTELGPVSDVLSFFGCAQAFWSPAAAPDQRALLDRFYRRYVPVTELPRARLVMAGIARAFRLVDAADVPWERMGVDMSRTQLELGKPNLAAVYRRYFHAFSHATRAATYFFESWAQDQAVRVAISDLPDLVIDGGRPLAEYDALEGQPFWLRDPQAHAPALQ